jgi:hypothetical protein
LKVKEEGRKLTGWLSLSTDPFKSRHAQLSANSRHSGATRSVESGIQKYRSEIPGMVLRTIPK